MVVPQPTDPVTPAVPEAPVSPAVPDPGSIAGSTRFLREDATFAVDPVPFLQSADYVTAMEARTAAGLAVGGPDDANDND